MPLPPLDVAQPFVGLGGARAPVVGYEADLVLFPFVKKFNRIETRRRIRKLAAAQSG
jgi:hypothetical protein